MLILLNPKRERFPKSEDQDLLQDKISFDEFTDEMARQDRELIHIGRRNKVFESDIVAGEEDQDGDRRGGDECQSRYGSVLA